MQLRVLGKSPSWPDAGGACSGYLIVHDGFSLLLDCGSGVLAQLRETQDYLSLDAVLLSHLHADHIIDLVAFSYALRLSPRQREPPHRPALHGPPGTAERLRCLGRCFEDEQLITGAFELCEYDPASELEVGPLTARFCEVPHYTQTFACQLTAGAGTITFGADCGPNEALVEFARGTDLLILEATLAEPDEAEPRGHLTPAEAGELGSRAEAKQLLISHFSDELGTDWVRAEAARGYGRSAEVGRTGAEYSL